MTGLARSDAASASLLLTLEGVATALLAWFVFHESFDRRIALGMACLVAGALVLSWTGQPTFSSFLGPLAILGACMAWGLDNNLTRNVSLADPPSEMHTHRHRQKRFGIRVPTRLTCTTSIGIEARRPVADSAACPLHRQSRCENRSGDSGWQGQR